ncbi:YmfQ family protein [Parvibaculum sp.]|uniref:YmfQ family protein n=1 Tax=Parvibaculum sp. TaxID=2024848 RepID=UPI0027307F97|nr:putative phage tail protein [Parvibaculum sp.]MDP1628867.1 DUF2313 domain-containing protein [Parvibaculum sp.]MDP2148262.1 DUF2313 domain-containing protein [Parvibaculum sp.]MDP3327741.1 DUF2313 domain-containing protein [Parvibaculum sp.]
MSGSDYCGIGPEDYLDQALALLPEGPAWPAERDAVLAAFWRATVASLARAHERMCGLLPESIPCFALDLLPDWERVYGLPDPCLGGEGQTLQERQLALCAKDTAQGGQSKAYFEAVAASLGYEVEIEEYRPFICGLSQCGITQLGGPELRFLWRVAVPGARVTWFRCGLSELGIDPLAKIARAEDLECRFEALQPAHTTILFSYEGA